MARGWSVLAVAVAAVGSLAAGAGAMTVKLSSRPAPPPPKAASAADVSAGESFAPLVDGPAAGSASAAEPILAEMLVRRARVFKIAARVYLDIKRAQWKEKRLRRRLGLPEEGDDDDAAITELWDATHDRNAALLTRKIKSLQGFWVKVGQYLSSRADVVPPAYLRDLATLQDSMPPKPYADVQQTLREELSPEALSMFEYIDPDPLSTASLAQVHRARLVDGREVVVKAQHRGVASLMLQDMENLKSIVKIIAYFDPDQDFGPIVKEYSSEVRKELDFRTEAQNMDDVRTLLKEEGIRAVVPRSVPGLVTKRVLVMDYCHGFPVRDLQALEKYKVDRKLLLSRIVGSWAAQMHVGGVFNADPHAGNILVSTNEEDGDSSVPVLLDFGLTKRLGPDIKVAFARLMHSSAENDLDGLLRSFDEMGLKLNRHDPFEDMAAMQRGFGDTVPQDEAKKAMKENDKKYRARMDAIREEQGIEKGQKLRSPVDAWPSELVFFSRVTAMLRGLCTGLGVRYPYLRTMAEAAKMTLHEAVPVEERATDLIHPSAWEIDTPLQRRLVAEIEKLRDEGQMIGLQICVMSEGKQVANVAGGILGPADPRPVTPSTLFCVFSVSKAVLTLGVLHLLQEGRIGLDDPVALHWPAFAAEGKGNITIRHVLSHQAGLSEVLPEDATVDALLDFHAMKLAVERAKPEHPAGEETRYHYLTYAWLCGGIIEAVTGRPYEELLSEIVTKPLGVCEELYLGGVPADIAAERLAVLSVERQLLEEERGEKEVDGNAPVGAVSPEQRSGNGDSGGSRKGVLAKYRGREHLLNPSVFNMRRVREGRLPSAAGHGSATALAAVFDSLIVSHEEDQNRGALLSADILEAARKRQLPKGRGITSGGAGPMLDDWAASFGLGLQLHDFTFLENDGKARSIGHAGLGGSVVLAVPEARMSVAFATNLLSKRSEAKMRLLGVVFDEFGLQAPESIGL